MLHTLLDSAVEPRLLATSSSFAGLLVMIATEVVVNA